MSTTDPKKFFAAQLRGIRGSRTQQEMAALLGVQRAQLARWEMGEILPRHDSLKRLADVAGVDIGSFFIDPAVRPAPGASKTFVLVIPGADGCRLRLPFDSIEQRLSAIETAISQLQAHMAASKAKLAGCSGVDSVTASDRSAAISAASRIADQTLDRKEKAGKRK